MSVVHIILTPDGCSLYHYAWTICGLFGGDVRVRFGTLAAKLDKPPSTHFLVSWFCADYGVGAVFCRWKGISVCVSCHINKPFVLVVFFYLSEKLPVP